MNLASPADYIIGYALALAAVLLLRWLLRR